MIFASVVVLYNNTEDELKNITYYTNQVDSIYVIDNSLESCLESLKSILYDSWEKINYFHFPENIGLSRALNFGIKKASKDGCEWALILDADSIVSSPIIKIYESYIKQYDNVAVYAPVHLTDRNRESVFEGIRDVRWSMTSGCIFNIPIFNKLGGFNENLFVDGLDIDYCFKARENGYKIKKCGNATINHFPAETKSLFILRKCVFKYGIASPWRYGLRISSTLWIALRYRSPRMMLAVIEIWLKVLLLFDNKKAYFEEMKKGLGEGWKMYKAWKKY